MAAHITCQTTDILPNSFPPPKPTPKDHGMMSEYEAPIIMNKETVIHSEITGGFDVDEDSYPVIRKPVPFSGALHGSLFTGDPALCVTPEKPAKRQTSRQHLKGGSPSKGDQRLNSRVRFDQTVEVKQLTPETSSEDIPRPSNRPAQRSLDLADIISGGAPGTIVQDLTKPLQVLAINEKNGVSEPSVFSNSTGEPIQTYQYEVQRESLMYPKTEVKFEKFTEEPITISSKDIFGLGIKPDRGGIGGLTPCLDDSGSDEELTQIMGNDHTLARPEFNSTLKFSKELQQLQSARIDIDAAVQQKLQSSTRTREKVEETAFSRVNTKWESKQFNDLISVSVDEETILKGEGMRFRAQKSTTAPKPTMGEGMLADAPDILDLFTMDLQREAASYSLVGLPSLQEEPHVADLTRSFDVYRHIKAWERL